MTRLDELHASGGVSVFSVKDISGGADVTVAVENTGDRPMRVTGLEVMALDQNGFVLRPLKQPNEVTVPPHAKEQVVVTMPGTAAQIKKVRFWGEDMDVPATP